MLPSCPHLFIIIRTDKWNKEAHSLKATGNQASWFKKKRSGCKPNSLPLPFSSLCPISDLCFLVSIFSNRSIPLQLVPVIFKQKEKLTLCRWEIIKLNITQPLKCRWLITRARLNILTDVVLDWLISALTLVEPSSSVDSTAPWPHPRWVYARQGLAQDDSHVNSAVESLPSEQKEMKLWLAYLYCEIYCSGRPDSGLSLWYSE